MVDKYLITGATGFLGQELVKCAVQRGVDVVGIGHSEDRIIQTKEKLGIDLFCLDIGTNKELLNSIVCENNITHIIHAAAMKHVGLCEKNPIKAIETNILGSKNILEVALRNSLKNLIGISTDKTLQPSCVYGMTKALMEKMFLQHGFSVYQGVNFFASTGSVLDIWYRQFLNKKKITIVGENCVRFFVEKEPTAKIILDQINTKQKIITNDICHKIYLYDLAEAFCEYFNYHEIKTIEKMTVEKKVEVLPNGVKVINADKNTIYNLIENHFQKVTTKEGF